MKRICYHFLGFLAGCLVLYIAFITSFEAVCYWTPGYYQKEFEKYNVLSSMEYWTGDYMEMDNLTEVMHQTMKYLRGNRQNLIVETDINGTTQEFYNDSEKSHMADVRDLFVLNIFLAVGSRPHLSRNCRLSHLHAARARCTLFLRKRLYRGLHLRACACCSHWHRGRH